ncbi:MAG TPA: transporter [Chitinophagaceae bacterium]|nr:transporter [Chitinophagaceae bacterium]
MHFFNPGYPVTLINPVRFLHLRHWRFPFTCFLFFSLLLPFTIRCQQLETDRPDQSDGASIVEKHKWQLESSLYYTALEGEKNAFISSTLLRYGVSKKLELRMLAEQGKNRDNFIEGTAHSQYPLAVSAKWGLVQDKKGWPDISVVGYLQLPFTNGDQPHYWSPALLLITEKEWGQFTLTSNVGIKQEPFSTDWDWQATADLKYALAEQWQIFGEYFSQFGKEEPFHNVDAGLLFFPSKKWMLSLSGGTSLRHMPGNRFVNAGFAVQLN